MSHDVFISYSSEDKKVADAACAVLERNGLRCWIAPRDILPGQDWSEAIVKGISETAVLVLIFSGSANTSVQVKREVEVAVDRGKPVVPVKIEDVRPSGALEFFIGTQHWMDAMTPPLEHHLEHLARTIHLLIHGQDTPPPPPPPSPPPPPPPPSGTKVLVWLAAGAATLSFVVLAIVLSRTSMPGPSGLSPPIDTYPPTISQETARLPASPPASSPSSPTTSPSSPTTSPSSPTTSPSSPTTSSSVPSASAISPAEQLPPRNCTVTAWDGKPRRIVWHKWPPRSSPSGVFLQLSSPELRDFGGDRRRIEQAEKAYRDRVWKTYLQAAGSACEGAQVMLYDSAPPHQNTIGHGLLFECTGQCDIEPALKEAMAKVKRSRVFKTEPKGPEKVYFELIR